MIEISADRSKPWWVVVTGRSHTKFYGGFTNQSEAAECAMERSKDAESADNLKLHGGFIFRYNVVPRPETEQ